METIWCRRIVYRQRSSIISQLNHAASNNRYIWIYHVSTLKCSGQFRFHTPQHFTKASTSTEQTQGIRKCEGSINLHRIRMQTRSGIRDILEHTECSTQEAKMKVNAGQVTRQSPQFRNVCQNCSVATINTYNGVHVRWKVSPVLQNVWLQYTSSYCQLPGRDPPLQVTRVHNGAEKHLIVSLN